MRTTDLRVSVEGDGFPRPPSRGETARRRTAPTRQIVIRGRRWERRHVRLRDLCAVPAAAALASIAAVAALGACFPTAAGPHLAHFAATSPAPGELAPDFILPDLQGDEQALASWIGERPLVLVLGSESCPVFRHRRHWLHGLVRRYRGRVDFLAVYTREAHPVGSPSPHTGEEWDLWVNWLSGVRIAEARSLPERIERASQARESLDLEIPLVVDRMDDAVWRAYGAASAPAFVIDREGKVAARQVWSDPSALRETLDRLLAADVGPADALFDEPVGPSNAP